MKIITASLLKHIKACELGIDFFVRNNLEGISTDKIETSYGDFSNFISWLKERKELIESINEEDINPYQYKIKNRKKDGKYIKRKYDGNNNVVHFSNTVIDDNNNEIVYVEERNYFYKPNGELYKIVDVKSNKILLHII